MLIVLIVTKSFFALTFPLFYSKDIENGRRRKTLSRRRSSFWGTNQALLPKNYFSRRRELEKDALDTSGLEGFEVTQEYIASLDYDHYRV